MVMPGLKLTVVLTDKNQNQSNLPYGHKVAIECQVCDLTFSALKVEIEEKKGWDYDNNRQAYWWVDEHSIEWFHDWDQKSEHFWAYHVSARKRPATCEILPNPVGKGKLVKLTWTTKDLRTKTEKRTTTKSRATQVAREMMHTWAIQYRAE